MGVVIKLFQVDQHQTLRKSRLSEMAQFNFFSWKKTVIDILNFPNKELEVEFMLNPFGRII